MLKEILTTEPVLQYYDPGKQIRISSDASQNGIGAVLLQLHDTTWTIVAYTSRAVTDAETRYAQLEKELVSITYACERFHQFIYGTKVLAETDHKPLVSIFKKALSDCPLRIQTLMLRVQRYDLEVMYIPGKLLIAADTLSRATDQSKSEKDLVIEKEVSLYVDMVIQCLPISEPRLAEIKCETSQDETCKMLQKVILEGWPTRKFDCDPFLM